MNEDERILLMKIKGYLWPDEKFIIFLAWFKLQVDYVWKKPHVRKLFKYSWGLESVPPALKPASIVKGNKKNFYRYMNSKRKTKEITGMAAEYGWKSGDNGHREGQVLNIFFSLGHYG